MKGECDSVRMKKKQQSSEVKIIKQEPLTPLLGKCRWHQSSSQEQETPTPMSDVKIIKQEELTPSLGTPLLGKHHWHQSSSQEQETPTPMQMISTLIALSHCPTTPLKWSYVNSKGDNFDSRRAISLSLIPPPLVSVTIKPTWQPALKSDDFDSRSVISLSPTPLPSTSSVSVTLSQSAAPGVIPVHVPIYNTAKWQGWLHAMYTIDMAVGFQQMNLPSLHACFSQEVLFSLIFGDAPFIRATCHQNCKALLEMDPTILEMHKQAGWTQDGLWSNYLAARCHALGEVSKKHSRCT
ncbi:hypothetical protein F4604DRAFT_1921258 [Suillus subluteus]|nr:hypothetical protein F4604DRAFT_1921258 [Suillus subluteus]